MLSRMQFFLLVFLFSILSIHAAKGQKETEVINDITSTTIVAPPQETRTKTDNNSKQRLIKDISHKIHVIAKKAFKRTNTAEEKLKLIELIKKKLTDSAKKKQTQLQLDDATINNYIDIIINSLSQDVGHLPNNTRRSGTIGHKEAIKTDTSSMIPRRNTAKEMKNISIHLNMERLKDKLIREISAKVDKISRKALEQIKNTEDIYAVMKDMKNKLITSARRRQKTLNLENENLNSYVDVILRSVENNLRTNAHLPSRRYLDSVHEKQEVSNNTSSRFQENPKEKSGGHIKVKTANEALCNSVEQEICRDISFILKATCTYDETALRIDKICDGYVDCPDASDEKNCSQQILTYIHKTNKILKELVSHISHNCLEDKEQFEINSQNKILSEVLNTQVAIIKSHAVLGNSAFKFDEEVLKIQKTSLTNDVASVILMTTNAINTVLCKEKHEEKKIVVLTRKMSEALDINLERTLNKIVKDSSKTCTCSKQRCEQNNCSERCKTICKNKYYLDRWMCSDEVASVPLDLICDGKTDCFDESDEYGCDQSNSMTKIENDRTYDEIMKLVRIKAPSDDFAHVLTKMNNLADLVKKLREATMQTPKLLNPPNIKVLRNNTFETIKMIYNESLKSLAFDDQIDRVHEVLRAIATKLLLVLKSSHTGNLKIQSSELCWCQESRCIMPKCSRPCQRACAMERRLMNHTCTDRKNITVSLELICNGRADCPMGDDELDCKKDVCQRRHVLTLANTLKPLGDNIKSRSLSATIQNWRQEAIEKVKTFDKNGTGRPTRPNIRRLLNRILLDLVMSYAAVGVSRRNNFESIKKEYENIADTLRRLYRTCEH